jgi:hypothetical protein
MVPRITAVLMPLKMDWVARLQPDAITAACEQVGYTAWRDRLLNPVIIVQWFLLQMLHGNTACHHLPHVSGIRFSVSAYGQARITWLLRVLGHLLARLGHSAHSARAPRLIPAEYGRR